MRAGVGGALGNAEKLKWFQICALARGGSSLKFAALSLSDGSQEFVRRWRVAGPALDAVKRAALGTMDDGEAMRQSGLVMDLAGRWLAQNPGVTRPSGMVEQQRVFTRWWSNRR